VAGRVKNIKIVLSKVCLYLKTISDVFSTIIEFGREFQTADAALL